ncbi:MAG: hypothetical protein AAB646_02615 [Patescibacteria group bacterium]
MNCYEMFDADADESFSQSLKARRIASANRMAALRNASVGRPDRPVFVADLEKVDGRIRRTRALRARGAPRSE